VLYSFAVDSCEKCGLTIGVFLWLKKVSSSIRALCALLFSEILSTESLNMSDLRWNKEFAMEQAGDDPELLAELLTMLADSSRDDLAKIKTAMTAENGDGVADAAHSIKGASASLGVEGLREVASDIEQKGRAATLADIDLGIIEGLVGQLGSLKV